MKEIVKVYTKHDAIPNCIKESYILPTRHPDILFERTEWATRFYIAGRIEEGLECVLFVHYLDEEG